MDKNIICAYLWQEVINKGFPSLSFGDTKKWVVKYISTLWRFWEVDPNIMMPRSNGIIKGRIDNPEMELWFEYEYRHDQHLHISFNHLNENIWWHHSDPKYFSFPFPSLLEKYDSQSQALAIFESGHLESVLDSMIFRPREHQHFKSPINEHRIRIGGGISNPFLYLFHLRYQLCPIPTNRDSERRRLLQLFESSIRASHLIEKDVLLAIP